MIAISLTELLIYVIIVLLIVNTFREKQGWTNWHVWSRTPKATTATLHRTLHELTSSKGPVLGMQFYGRNTVILSSFELMKTVLGNQSMAGGRPHSFHSNLDESNESPMGITWGFGQSWKELKAVSKSQLRHLCANQSLMTVLIQKEIDNILLTVPVSMHQIALNLKDLDLYSSCHRILWGVLVGPQEAATSPKILNILNYYKTFIEPTNDSNVWYSYSSWLLNNAQHVLPLGYVNIVRQFIEEKARNNEHLNEDKGFVDSLLEVLSNGVTRKDAIDNRNYAVQQLTATVSDMCASGTQAMGNAIKWMIHFLAENPRVQRRIFQEIRDENANPKGHFSKTVYRRATLFEVFRVGNVLPIPIPRCATSTFSINGFVVHEGCSIIYNLESVFKDRNYWGPNVNEFMPERFLDESGTKLIKTERMAIFGFGKRSCLGDSLVWVTLMKYLTVICNTLELSQFSNAIHAKEQLRCRLVNVVHVRRR